MNPAECPVPNPAVVLREVFDDWAVLFNPDTADAVGINPVGVAVWKLLDGKRTIEEIAGEVARFFTDVPSNVLDEISTFITQLAQHGFVGFERKDPP